MMLVNSVSLHLQARMRGTFMSVGQSLLVRRQLELERSLKEKMIHSLMPTQVADWLMKETLAEDSEDGGQDREDGAILQAVSRGQLFEFCFVFLHVILTQSPHL